jgi:hypothetical protein
MLYRYRSEVADRRKAARAEEERKEVVDGRHKAGHDDGEGGEAER